jgi:hypothetical protein
LLHLTHSNRLVENMIVYEFYLPDKEKGDKLVGILPERRNRKERVDHESIMNWIRTIYATNKDMNNIFYIQVEL